MNFIKIFFFCIINDNHGDWGLEKSEKKLRSERSEKSQKSQKKDYSQKKDKNQINGLLQPDSIALENFDEEHEKNLGPKTPQEKILIYSSKKYQKLD